MKPNKDKSAFAVSVFESGLSKREYIAAMAMQALISNPNIIIRPQPENGDMQMQLKVFSKVAIECADSLLEQLDKTN